MIATEGVTVPRSVERRNKIRAGQAEPTSHGEAGYDQGCPCERCKQAHADRAARRRRRRRWVPFDQIPHGANGYTNYECRCDDCIEGHRVERADERERHRKAA